MRIQWYGQSAFDLARRVFIDPFGDVSALAARGWQFDYPAIEGIEPELLLVTHEHLDHNGVEAIGGSPAVIRSTAGTLESPVGEVVAVASEHDAVLVVDDSHGIGVVGETGRGVLEHYGLLGREDVIVTGTLGKALGGGAGGFIAGGEALCAVLEQRSRPQLYSNGLPPTVAASARRALAELRERPELVTRLRHNAATMRAAIAATGLRPLEGESAIVPIIVGETAAAIAISRALLERGIYVTGFGYPVVPEGTARIRVQVSAALDGDQIELAAATIGSVVAELGGG